MTGNNKKIKVYVIYRSLSQNNSEFDSLLLHLEQRFRGISKCKSTAPVITGDFNTRSLSWWSGDINTWNKRKGAKLYSNSNEFSPLTFEPTNIQRNSSSWIDLDWSTKCFSKLCSRCIFTSKLSSTNFTYWL